MLKVFGSGPYTPKDLYLLLSLCECPGTMLVSICHLVLLNDITQAKYLAAVAKKPWTLTTVTAGISWAYPEADVPLSQVRCPYIGAFSKFASFKWMCSKGEMGPNGSCDIFVIGARLVTTVECHYLSNLAGINCMGIITERVVFCSV